VNKMNNTNNTNNTNNRKNVDLLEMNLRELNLHILKVSMSSLSCALNLLNTRSEQAKHFASILGEWHTQIHSAMSAMLLPYIFHTFAFPDVEYYSQSGANNYGCALFGILVEVQPMCTNSGGISGGSKNSVLTGGGNKNVFQPYILYVENDFPNLVCILFLNPLTSEWDVATGSVNVMALHVKLITQRLRNKA
jgi:hypothetical protein